MKIRKIAEKVFDIESNEIKNLSALLNNDFELAVKSIIDSKGKLIVSGMGKSGLVGKKIAATLASTGTPSFFLHPAEAYHGDLGMIESNDILLLISNSGETDELLRIIPFLKEQGNITISMSGNPNSTLAKNTDYHLNISVSKEACPLSLAPTSSTTATMVMGDALAIALMEIKDFQDLQFARYHPGGSLGKKLLHNVGMLMKKDELPIANENQTLKDVVTIISEGKYGLSVITKGEKVAGVITDGDIRRAMEEHQANFFSLKAKDIMNISPITVLENMKLSEAENLLSSNKISALLVVDERKNLIGLFHSHDLTK